MNLYKFFQLHCAWVTYEQQEESEFSTREELDVSLLE